jgi:hypothetical protein
MIHNQLIDSNTKATKYTEENGSQQELVIAACPLQWLRAGTEERWKCEALVPKLKS